MTLETIGQLGAVGVISFIAYLLVKAGIKQQGTLVETNERIASSFKNTIDNHLGDSQRCLKENLQGTRELTKEVGKLKTAVRELSGQIKKNGRV